MAPPAAPDSWLDQHYAASQTLVKIGRRRRLNLLIAGEGDPTVVFAPGLNGTTLHWARVQPAVALHNRTVAFDKAGIGFSDPGRLPRTASAVVGDLRAALKAAGIAPPYVLVGHSLGGLQMRLFAFRHPHEVAGMVMVDSASEHQYRRFADALGDSGDGPVLIAELGAYARLARLARTGGLAPGTPDYQRAVGPPSPLRTAAMQAAHVAQRTSAAYWRALRSEAAARYGPGGRSASSDEVAAARRPLGDMPLIVLTAANSPQPRPGKSAPAAETRRQLWRAMHDEIAALSMRGERRTVDAGHAIQLQKPDVVIAAVAEVIAMARGG